MKNKPINITPGLLELVKDTYTIILQDNVITAREMEYLKKLYWIIYDKENENMETIKQDLTQLKGWVIKDVSK